MSRFRSRYIIMLLFVSLLTFYPLLMLLYGSFRTAAPGLPSTWSAKAYQTVYSEPLTWITLGNSFFLASMVTIYSLLIAIFFAWIVARTDVPWRGLVTPIMVLTFFLPSIFFAMSWSMLGNEKAGLLNHGFKWLFNVPGPFNINTWPGLIYTMVLSVTPFKFLLLVNTFRLMDNTLEEAAMLSGANRIKVFLRIIIPVLSPTIIGITILSFVKALQTLEIPLFIGFSSKIYVVSTRIFDYISNYFPARYAEATALGIVLVLIMLILGMWQLKLLGNRDYFTVSGKGFRPDIIVLGKVKFLGTAAIVLYGLLALVLPFIQLFIGSFQKVFGLYNMGMFTFQNYESVFSRPLIWKSLWNTVWVASVGGFLAMVLGCLVALVLVRSRSLLNKPIEFVSWLPWTMPGIVLGVAILWAYLTVPGLKQLYGTVWILIIAVVITVLPLAVSVIKGALKQVHIDLEESARMFGANRVYAFLFITMRVIWPTFAYGWMVSAIIISGEFSIPMFLYTPGSEVLTIVIFQLFSEGKVEDAAAVFTVIIFGILALFLVFKGLSYVNHFILSKWLDAKGYKHSVKNVQSGVVVRRIE